MIPGSKIILLIGLLVTLLVPNLSGQSSFLGLRISRMYFGFNRHIELEGAPIALSSFASSESELRFREIVVGGSFEFSKNQDTYRRVILQYQENLSNDSRVWNLAGSERVTLSFHQSSPSITGAFSLGRILRTKRLKFSLGIETGITFTPAFDQSEFYTFFDSLGIEEGSISIRADDPGNYQPYLKWFGSIYYELSPRFSLGVEVAYGLQGFFSQGNKVIEYKNFDPAGNLLTVDNESSEVNSFQISLPSRIDLPFIGLTYRIPSKPLFKGN